MPAQSASWLLQVDHRCLPPLPPAPLSLGLSLSLCFPLPKLRGNNERVNFPSRVPSALSTLTARPRVRSRPYFLVQFFSFPARSLSLSPFTRYRPRLLMARDCLSRLSGARTTASIYPRRDFCPPRDRCRRHAPEPILTFHFSRRGSTFGVPSPPRVGRRHVAKLALHERQQRKFFLFLSLRARFSRFLPRPLHFPLVPAYSPTRIREHLNFAPSPPSSRLLTWYRFLFK